jgi:hypothetical protein
MIPVAPVALDARRVFCALVLAVVTAHAPQAAEADIAGGWTIAFSLPWGGSASYPMWVNQDGTKLTGRVTFPGVAEYQIKGTVKEDRFTIVWQTVVDGEFVDVAFAGRVAGDEITGTAKIGTYPERELYARRTER